MTIDWGSAFQYNPGSAFPAPDLRTVFNKPKKGAFSGIDFSTGKRVDLSKYLPTSGLDVAFSPNSTENPYLQQNTGSAVPSLDPAAQATIDYVKALLPLDRARRQEIQSETEESTARQIRQLYPYLSAAGAESTARNLAASQAYRAFAEQLPSSVQNIMASKQAQATSAAGAEAERQRATAAQQDAASRYPGRFAGQYIQVG
jgi:hypothetical protein